MDSDLETVEKHWKRIAILSLLLLLDLVLIIGVWRCWRQTKPAAANQDYQPVMAKPMRSINQQATTHQPQQHPPHFEHPHSLYFSQDAQPLQPPLDPLRHPLGFALVNKEDPQPPMLHEQRMQRPRTFAYDTDGPMHGALP